MKEIEIGEYVRTNNKGIKRIERIDNNKTVNKYLYFTGVEDFEGKEYGIIKTTEIVKHDKSLIMLIEVGDFVNGVEVIKILPDTFGRCYRIELANHYIISYLDFNKIKTILTKEQYMANCYKAGGE